MSGARTSTCGASRIPACGRPNPSAVWVKGEGGGPGRARGQGRSARSGTAGAGRGSRGPAGLSLRGRPSPKGETYASRLETLVGTKGGVRRQCAWHVGSGASRGARHCSDRRLPRESTASGPESLVPPRPLWALQTARWQRRPPGPNPGTALRDPGPRRRLGSLSPQRKASPPPCLRARTLRRGVPW